MPATTVVPRAEATAASSAANGPSSASAYPLRSEPGSPKSRAKASGSTTRSGPPASGTSSDSRARLAAGSRPEATWTAVTRNSSTRSTLPAGR